MKLYLSLIVFLGLLTATHAQDRTKKIDVWGGATHFTPLKSPGNTDKGAGGTLGLGYQIDYTEKFGLNFRVNYQTMVWFNQFDCNGDFDNVIVCVSSNSRFSERLITVPVLARWSFGKKTKLVLDLGPQYNLNLGRFVQSSLEDGTTSEYFHKDLEGDLLLSTGIGVAYPINDKFELQAETRLGWSLLNRNFSRHIQWQFQIGANYSLNK